MPDVQMSAANEDGEEQQEQCETEDLRHGDNIARRIENGRVRSEVFELLHTDTDAVGKAFASALAQHFVGAVIAADMAKLEAFVGRYRTHVTRAARTRITKFARAWLHAARGSIGTDESARAAIGARCVVEKGAGSGRNAHRNMHRLFTQNVFSHRPRRAVGTGCTRFDVAAAIRSAHADVGGQHAYTPERCSAVRCLLARLTRLKHARRHALRDRP